MKPSSIININEGRGKPSYSRPALTRKKPGFTDKQFLVPEASIQCGVLFFLLQQTEFLNIRRLDLTGTCHPRLVTRDQLIEFQVNDGHMPLKLHQFGGASLALALADEDDAVQELPNCPEVVE